MNHHEIIVVGGGAAGMLAAFFAAREGAKVLLLERNEKLGKKIYITGKGRCNVTNACDTEEFLRNVPRNPRFLYSALRLLPPDAMLALLEELGCPTKVERGRRAFPISDKASDVTRALENGLRAAHVDIRFHARVKSILAEENKAVGVALENGERILAARVILCTGGLSYPSTGSDGDGHRLAQETGHAMIPCRPSLVGLKTKENWPMELQGLTLKNICLSGRSHGKIIYSELGEMLFTHFGVSGPLVLELSSHLPENQPTEALLDLKPGLTHEQLSARLTRELSAAGKKQLSTVLQALLPRAFAAIFPRLCGVEGTLPCSQVSAKMREAIVQTLKALPLTVAGLRPMTEAIITRGGVNVKEISPGTMMSKRMENLYFAGELVDVDAHTGGYNLQIAFATGALAGKSAAKALLS